jgi:hypothetical protein
LTLIFLISVNQFNHDNQRSIDFKKNNFRPEQGEHAGSPLRANVGANLRVRPFEIKYLKIYIAIKRIEHRFN